ncbi:MAG TPA: VIT1/CCC1 transporter family protein [Candidatus Saccharimonadia bacterium]|jgi:VIT1/CCC1 family predicted Fe2+/Mn2+ transporter|nr:VIT1/CCC1 transporter family protein [Candidatus Saccharimonadia bacterium]
MTHHVHHPHAQTIRKLERAQSGAARAALLGISDGLVTNVSLLLGVAGAGAAPSVVRVAGIASLIAGAFSMAVGEYISMQGQSELLEGILMVEREELKQHPESARRALKEVLLADGVSDATATAASEQVARDPEKSMAMYARGKLGVNPDELGSAWQAAMSSLVTFAIGALIPLAPWFFGSGLGASITSVAISAIAALAIGAYLGNITSGSWIRAALRQLFVLALAAGATYWVGRIFGTMKL